MDDRLHQPYRKELIPGYDEAARGAVEAGAAAVAISGAGPSLVAFAPDRHQAISAAMAAGFERAGLGARTFVLPLDRQGVRLSAAG
jgi:homoserine kinase